MEILIPIAIFIVVFLVFREVVLWYFRINEMADTLQEINRNIARLANENSSNNSTESTNSSESKNT